MVGREEIRQTEDGGFRLYWRDDSGKTRSRPIAAGKAVAAVGRRDRARGLTVKEALDGYAREHRVADEQRRENIIRHLSTFFKDDTLASVDISRSRDYAVARRNGKIGGGARRAEKTGADATIRRELVVLASAAKHALKHKRITQMPVIELPAENSTTGHDDEVSYYSKEELARLFDNSTGELHHFIALAYYSGARRASIEGLRRGQVQWDRRRILLQPAGKIATKKRQPIVPIFKAMEPHLRALWDASPNDRLFVRGEFYTVFRALCERLGMSDKSHPHLLRHSRVTHLLMQGKSIYDVARLIGDTVGTVEKTYGHHSPSFLADLLD